MSITFCYSCKKETGMLNKQEVVRSNHHQIFKGICRYCGREVLLFTENNISQQADKKQNDNS